jgi:hypothetical protein
MAMAKVSIGHGRREKVDGSGLDRKKARRRKGDERQRREERERREGAATRDRALATRIRARVRREG